MRKSYVYILSGKYHATLYVGVTANLISRMQAHKNKLADSFTKKYNITDLVYYEIFDDIHLAIKREKQLKKWTRSWKKKLIMRHNPEWRDLTDNIKQELLPQSQLADQ